MSGQNGETKVLVVDDEPQVLTSLKGLLEDDFTVLMCTDAEEALRLLSLEQVAVILSDQRMPGLSGDQFLSRAREVSRATRVLITGYADLNALVRAVNLGNIYAYVAKPWNPEELIITIQKAADHYRLMLENQRLTASLLETNTRLQAVNRQQVADLKRIHLLNQIARAIAERQDLRSIFCAVLQHLEDHLPVDFGGVYLLSLEGDALTVAARGPKSEMLAAGLGLPEKMSLAVGQMVEQTGLGPCLKGETLYVPDLREMDALFPQKLAEAGLRSRVGVPLLVEEKVIGVLTVARRQADGFSGAEGEFLRTVTEHVALAARSAQLYQNLQGAYDDLRQTQQVVMQQERLKALGQMASGIAHDVNNALSPVLGYAQMLLMEEEKLSQDQVQYLNIIQRSARDIIQIVDRMRAFYRQREAQEALFPVSLNEAVKQVIDLTRPRWRDMPQERGVVIEMQADLQEGLPLVMGVESEVREALTNLIFNAVDAMPEGGVITLRTRLDGQQIVLEVLDTGTGMDEETRQRCLEPFYSTKGDLGTGLGLAMVFGTMQRHEGRVEVESELGGGTTVRLVFPVRRPGVQPDAQLERVGRYAGPALRVLCIDDEPLLRDLVKRMLEKDGHAAEVADGGQAGIDAFRAARGRGAPFDVVITDVGMPYVGGREVARTVKQESPDTPVILLTGWGSSWNEGGNLPAQADYLLNKPPEISALRRALEQVCAKR